MLGPSLSAIEDWILNPPLVPRGKKSHVDPFKSENSNTDSNASSLGESLYKLFLSFGMSSFSDENAYNDNAETELESPADMCTGIFLHVFMDSPQV